MRTILYLIIYFSYAEHALIRQSENSEIHTPGLTRNYRRNHRVNVHGSGLGYYPRLVGEDSNFGPDLYDYQDLRIDERPSVYTSSLAPAQDRNLRRLSESILTSLCFAHIRAAGAFFSPVHEFNCHPFRAGRYCFMHNGGVAKINLIKRKLLENVPQHIYKRIMGSTDTEVVFAVFLTFLPNNGDYTKTYGPDVMKSCLVKTIAKIEYLTGSLTDLEKNNSKDDEPVAASKSSLNFAVTDGESVVVTRFRSGSNDGPSLYITHTSRYHVDAIHHDLRHNAQAQSRRHQSFVNVKKLQNNTKVNSCKDTVIVCSEPLDYDDRDWTLIPNNNIVVIYPEGYVKRHVFESENNKNKIPLTVSYTSLTRKLLRDNVENVILKDSSCTNQTTLRRNITETTGIKGNTRLVPLTIAIGICLGFFLKRNINL
jgi:predicted glutamine amidotransferase